MSLKECDSLADWLDDVTHSMRHFQECRRMVVATARLPGGELDAEDIAEGAMDGREVELLECGHWQTLPGQTFHGRPGENRTCRSCAKLSSLYTDVGQRAVKRFKPRIHEGPWGRERDRN